MLIARDVSFRVPGRRGAGSGAGATLVEGISAEFAPGVLALIVGANGAGKSTLVKLLSGRLAPTTGAVLLHDRRVREWESGALARTRSVLSQEVELAFPLRVWEVVMMGRYAHFVGRPSDHDEAVCEEAMRYFDVRDLAQRDYLTLSGGERQRVQFARVCAQIWTEPADASGARCLLLDEPLTFLDVRHQFGFMRGIRELMERERLIVAGVVHDLNLAARFADQVLLLENGRLLACGAPRDVLTPDLVERAFGIRPTIHHTRSGLHLLLE